MPLLDTAGVQLRLILEIESRDAPKRFAMAGVATGLVGTFGSWQLAALAAIIMLLFEVGLYVCVKALPPKNTPPSRVLTLIAIVVNSMSSVGYCTPGVILLSLPSTAAQIIGVFWIGGCMTHALAANGIAVAIGWAGLGLQFMCLAVGMVLFNTEARPAMTMLDHAIVAATTVIFCWNFFDAMRAQSANRRAFGEARAQAEDRLEQLNFQANHDALTNLPNLRALMNAMEHAILKEPLSVIHLDLDRFKEVNDTHGHAGGDAALQHTASSLRSLFGQGEVCARLGGDEFVVLLKGQAHESHVKELADAVIAAISTPFMYGSERLEIGASVGIAQSLPIDERSADELLHHADLALYESKRSGRGLALPCTQEMLDGHLQFQEMSEDIRRGLNNQEFVAHFQLQVHGASGALIGFEALARWNHPKRGLLTPGDFMATAQRAGLMPALDQEVRKSALATLSMWDRQGLAIPKISLNVTVQDLIRPEFCDALMWDLDAQNLEPERITLEILESVLYDDTATAVQSACNRLVANGFTLALDDFGTGHASVLSLVDLPIAMVKIDRAFTASVAADARKRVLVSAMIDMASNLGVDVLAEGVNSDADVETLQAMGCELFQAFHFHRPMSGDAALAFVEVHRLSHQTLERKWSNS